MPVPSFTIDGVLPPYVGSDGPGGAISDMTPYQASPTEVIKALGYTPERRHMLRNWIDHRSRLRQLGITDGFQCLDGSFVETKQPKDLDVVTFFHRPLVANNPSQIQALFMTNPETFNRVRVKGLYSLDVFFVDLNGSPKSTVTYSIYLFGLFSHRRQDDVWKGMLQVDLKSVQDDADGLIALDLLDLPKAAQGPEL